MGIIPPTVGVGFDGCVFPKSGVAFAWVLEREMAVPARGPLMAGRRNSLDQRDQLREARLIMTTHEERLRQKLAPETVGTTLIRAGCFLSAYELIKSDIVDGVRGFFWCSFKNGKDHYDETRYQRDVLSRDPKSRYQACCAWLVEMEALTSEQVEQLEAIHRHRQEIAHELPKLLVDPDFEVKTDLLLAALGCLRSLGTFWGSINVDTNADFDGVEIDYDGIKSGAFMLMNTWWRCVGSILLRALTMLRI